MKTSISLALVLLALSGCAVVPYGPAAPVVYAAPPPPAAVVVRPYYGYYGYGPYWRRW
jgi:hypothetical protein